MFLANTATTMRVICFLICFQSGWVMCHSCLCASALTAGPRTSISSPTARPGTILKSHAAHPHTTLTPPAAGREVHSATYIFITIGGRRHVEACVPPTRPRISDPPHRQSQRHAYPRNSRSVRSNALGTTKPVSTSICQTWSRLLPQSVHWHARVTSQTLRVHTKVIS